MEQALIDLFGINSEHARMIDELIEPQRSRKIKEMSEWLKVKRLDWS